MRWEWRKYEVRWLAEEVQVVSGTSKEGREWPPVADRSFELMVFAYLLPRICISEVV